MLVEECGEECNDECSHESERVQSRHEIFDWDERGLIYRRVVYEMEVFRNIWWSH